MEGSTGKSKAISDKPRGTPPDVKVRTVDPKLIREALCPTKIHVPLPTYDPESSFKVALTLDLQEDHYKEAEGGIIQR